MIFIKFCLNCENQIPEELLKHSEDFCSPECATEYQGRCDNNALARAQEIPPNSVPAIDGQQRILTRATQQTSFNNGQLPNRPEDILGTPANITNSLLQFAGVPQDTIKEVIDKLGNNDEMAQNGPTNVKPQP